MLPPGLELNRNAAAVTEPISADGDHWSLRLLFRNATAAVITESVDIPVSVWCCIDFPVPPCARSGEKGFEAGVFPEVVHSPCRAPRQTPLARGEAEELVAGFCRLWPEAEAQFKI